MFQIAKYGQVKDNCREMIEVASAISSTTTHVSAQSQNPVALVVTEQIVIHEIPSEVQENINTEQPQADMGPWNIPKYNARKRKNNKWQKTKKANEGNNSNDNSTRGQATNQVVVMHEFIEVEQDVQMEKMNKVRLQVPLTIQCSRVKTLLNLE